MSNDKKSATLGQVLDEIADRYFAAGHDSYTANLLALRDIVKVLAEADSLVAGFLKYAFGGDR